MRPDRSLAKSTSPGTPGRVLLLRQVATSPTAQLYAAQRETDAGPELLAVKLFHRDIDEQHVLGVQQRAARLGTLGHRHIVTPHQVLDVNGRLGLVSPFVDGIDLLEWVEVLRETNTRMPPRVICELLRGVAVALDAAMHRIPWGRTRPLKFLHGDLKPTNIMVTRDGELKVLDFGTGASHFEGQAVPTRTARNYLSPERSLGRPPTPASDVYSLGILGIELLHDSWMHVIPSAPVEHQKHLTQLLRQAEFKLRSSADQQTLRSLLLRMSRHSPGGRPNAAVVAQTLRRLADRAPGPSLESFCHENAGPWLMTIPEDPETALMVQVAPVSLEPVDLFEREHTIEDSATQSNTRPDAAIPGGLADDPSAVFLRSGNEWEEEDSITQSIALKTGAALKARRTNLEDEATAHQDGNRPVLEDEPTQMAGSEEPTGEVEEPTVTQLDAPTQERPGPLEPAQPDEEQDEDIEPEVVPPKTSSEVIRYQDVRVQDADFEDEGFSVGWVVAVTAATGCASFGVVLAVLTAFGAFYAVMML